MIEVILRQFGLEKADAERLVREFPEFVERVKAFAVQVPETLNAQHEAVGKLAGVIDAQTEFLALVRRDQEKIMEKLGIEFERTEAASIAAPHKPH